MPVLPSFFPLRVYVTAPPRGVLPSDNGACSGPMDGSVCYEVTFRPDSDTGGSSTVERLLPVDVYNLN